MQVSFNSHNARRAITNACNSILTSNSSFFSKLSAAHSIACAQQTLDTLTDIRQDVDVFSLLCGIFQKEKSWLPFGKPTIFTNQLASELIKGRYIIHDDGVTDELNSDVFHSSLLRSDFVMSASLEFTQSDQPDRIYNVHVATHTILKFLSLNSSRNESHAVEMSDIKHDE